MTFTCLLWSAFIYIDKCSCVLSAICLKSNVLSICTDLIWVKSRVRLTATGSYLLRVTVFLCLLSPCCVTAGCCSTVQRPRALPLSLHTPVVSALSRSFHRPSALSLRGVQLEAELNRWAAVSREWNFSPTGPWRVGLGMRRWGRGWGAVGEAPHKASFMSPR